MPIILTKGLTEKCSDCGIALYKEEIALEIRGEFIDYIEHKPGEISIIFCSGCRERILNYLNMSIGDAILKRAELDNVPVAKPITVSETEIDDFRTPDDAGVGI